jgi:hypothetical protein
MIKANELRIGNWVDFSEDSTLFQVTEISEKGLGVKNDNEETWIDLDQFEPIPLTPEILVNNLGFEKIEESYSGFHFENERCWIYIFPKSGRFEIEINCGVDRFNLYSNYKLELHIFQNLYYFITSVELEIKGM